MKQPNLGKKILKLRLANNLTQVELAEKCNLSLRTIQRIECAEVEPRSHTVKVIFSSLNYDLNNSLKSLHYTSYRNFFKNITTFEKLLKFKILLFNLKTNTMKKVSLLSLIVVFISIGIFLTNTHLNAQAIDGWFIAGNKPNSYSFGLDYSIYKTGSSSAFLESKDKKIEGFGTLMQTCSAEDYLGKRIKMTGYVKAENVTAWAGMWLRVDAKQTKKLLSFDNMYDRPIKGDKDWKKYEIILDVPEESSTLNFGIMLNGTGKVWFDNLSFEVVDKLKTKLTKEQEMLKKPTNLNFGK
ncbi:MAG: helix-turn-helix transcriptional regulator [Salinivirgaceae bacterium]|nr:helix-turn-helix transcriptional regulator [Salinivirgaceae bacterium]